MSLKEAADNLGNMLIEGLGGLLGKATRAATHAIDGAAEGIAGFGAAVGAAIGATVSSSVSSGHSASTAVQYEPVIAQAKTTQFDVNMADIGTFSPMVGGNAMKSSGMGMSNFS